MSKTQCPYELLAIDINATEGDIKKAFRKLSMTCHPDRVGVDNPDRAAKTVLFTQLTEAKETLIDPKLRNAYNHGGWDFVKHIKETQHAMDQRKIKCEPLVVENKLSLAQLYAGEKVTLEVKVPVHNEDGTITESIFPMDFPPEVGKLVAQNEGIQKPDHIPGDVIVVNSLEDNCPFEIRRQDLVFTADLDLRDLLQGYSIVLPHPDGSKLIKGRYMARNNDDDNLLIFPDLGLPDPRRRGRRGDLIVHLVPDIASICNLASNKETVNTICQAIDQVCAPRPEFDDEVVDITSQSKSPSQMRGNMGGLEQMLLGGMIPGMPGAMSIPLGGSDDGAPCPVQ
jgi:DnaJ-class molecular chaperone